MYWRQYPLNHHSTYTQSSFFQPQMPTKYPEDIECVHPSSNPKKGAIYVSNVEAAENPSTLKKHGIQSVMTCAKGYHKNIPKNHIKMFKYFPCEDKQSCNISQYFDEAVDFIKESLAQTNILVHCIAGVSRSVSMVLAYLMKEKGMTYDKAYRQVKDYRRIISPNSGFIEQLRLYEVKLRREKNRQRTTTERKPIKKQNNYFESRQNQQDLWQKTSSKTNNFDQDNFTPKKSLHTQYSTKNKLYEPTSSKKEYFKEMNDDLNTKIQAIHEKYQKAREKLLSKRSETLKGFSVEKTTPAQSRSSYSIGKFESIEDDRDRKYKYADIYERKYDYGLIMNGQLGGYRRRYNY